MSKCEYYHPSQSDCSGEAKLRGSMTAYHFEGVINSPEDPNRDFFACDRHYEEYCDYW